MSGPSVTTASWLLRRVAGETRALHRAADADRLALMNVRTLAQYTTLLARIHGFESVVEHAVTRVFGLEPSLSGLRLRIGRLHDDLLALGMTELDVSSLPRCETVAVSNRAEALGWMYVVERSMLLAGLIRRFLATELPTTVALAPRFLDAYEGVAGSRLRVLGDFMTEQANRRLVGSEAIVKAATRAFVVQEHWYARSRRTKAAPSTIGRPEPRDAA